MTEADNQNSLEDISRTLRKFFADLLGINYQFTYDELENELRNARIDKTIWENIGRFFHKLEETQYSGGAITDSDIRKISDEAYSIIQQITGYSGEIKEARPRTLPEKMFKKIENLTGLKINLSRNRRAKPTESAGALPVPPAAAPGPEEIQESQAPTKMPFREQHATGPLLNSTVAEVMQNIDNYVGRAVRFRGTIEFINKILETGDFWYMFWDNTGKITAMSKFTEKYKGSGKLIAMPKKTIMGEAFLVIEAFD